jgi:hypothetical protein
MFVLAIPKPPVLTEFTQGDDGPAELPEVLATPIHISDACDVVPVAPDENAALDPVPE